MQRQRNVSERCLRLAELQTYTATAGGRTLPRLQLRGRQPCRATTHKHKLAHRPESRRHSRRAFGQHALPDNNRQTQDEFMEEAYVLYIINLYTLGKADEEINLPLFHAELTSAQLSELKEFIEIKQLKPSLTCIRYDYSPSNFYKDEINAHTETLKAHTIKLFNMNESKINFYNFEINRYNNQYQKSKKYEEKNSINAEGYEY